MSDKSQKPPLRFKGFTEPWEQRKLSDLFVKGGSGGTPLSSNRSYYDEGQIPFLGISDITNSNGTIFETEKRITELGLNNSAAWIVPKGSISLAMYASVGKIAILGVDSSTSQAFYNMVFSDDSLKRFTYQRLVKANDDEEWLALISTGTQANLNAEKVKSFEIMIPDKKERLKISDLMFNLDNLITLHQRKYDKLSSIKKGLLEKMFPDSNSSTPKIRFSGFFDAWEQRKLGDIYEFTKGKGLSLDTFYEGDKSPAIAYGHLYTQYTEVISKVKLSSNEDAPLSKAGDILFPGSSTVPNGTAQSNAILLDNIKLGGDVIIARATNDKPDPSFVSYQINAQKTKLYPITVGTTITHMYGKNIAEISYSFPEMIEQKKIGLLFANLDNLITLHQRKLNKLQNIKKACLQRMFI